jgi:hypothetical protein
MDIKTVPIKISEKINKIMEGRGIKEEDIREVLKYGESTGKKLYMEGENRYLAKKRLDNFTPNVEYSIGDNEIEILNLYSYIITLTKSATE